MHIISSAMPSQHAPSVMLVNAQSICPSTTPPVGAYPAPRLGVSQSLIWLLQKGHQSRTVLPLCPVLDRPALLLMTPRYAHLMHQTVLPLPGDQLHDQQRLLLPRPMHSPSPKSGMLLFVFPAPLSAVPGCRYKPPCR